MTHSLPKVTQDYLAYGASNGNRNNALFAAAAQFRDARYTLEEAIEELLPRATADGLEKSSILSTIRSAYAHALRDECATGKPAPQTTNGSAAPIYRKTLVQPATIPEPLEAIKFLDTFPPRAWISIGYGYEKKDDKGKISIPISPGEARTREAWIADIKLRGMDKVFPYKDGLFVRVNPMLNGTGTSDKEVALYRDVLVESDEGKFEDQLGAIRCITLPISSIVCSAGRSEQARVRIDAPDEATYRERFGILRQFCVESLGLKMDAKNINPSRYSRFPGGRRIRRDHETNEKILDEKGREIIDIQTLLDVNIPGKSWDEWVDSLPVDDGDNTEWFDLDALFNFDRENDPDSLIGNRWLCRGDSFILQGYTGIGKSSLALQMAMCWALGRDFFGIKPKRALKILLIQAENNAGDIAEPLQDICEYALKLSDKEKQKLKENLIIGRQSTKSGAVAMATYVRTLISKHKPDMCIFDPLLSYFGNDISSQAAASEFFRNYLQPIQNETGVILGFVHHLGKPPKSSDQRQGPMLYSGLGSSDIMNWAREMITLTPEDGLHKLDFGKRGLKAGIVNEQGQSISEIRIKRASGNQCYWSIASLDTVATSIKSGRKPTPADLLRVIPIVDPVRREKVRELAKNIGINRDPADELLKQLVESGKVSEILTPRKGTNPERKYVRNRDFTDEP